MALESDQTQEKVVLTVTGSLAANVTDKTLKFSIRDLEKLGTISFSTTTPWFDGQVLFEGGSFKKLFEYIKPQGNLLEVIALNDYVITIPIDDLVNNDAILAVKRNGQYMSIQDKGPLFIVYPYDSQMRLKNQIYYTRSVWQVYKFIIR